MSLSLLLQPQSTRIQIQADSLLRENHRQAIHSLILFRFIFPSLFLICTHFKLNFLQRNSFFLLVFDSILF
jgi:membrane-bound metal-dependent hydrolase YbcI (DUF457 family)